MSTRFGTPGLLLRAALLGALLGLGPSCTPQRQHTVPVQREPLASAEVERLLLGAVEEARERVVVEGEEPQGLGLKEYLAGQAPRLGLEAAHLQAEVTRWCEEVRARHDNFHHESLVNFALGRFHGASADSVASAAQKNQGRVPLAPGEPLGVSLARDLRLAGHGLYLAREFRRALVNYEAALGHFSREEEPLLWASLQVDVSDARTAAALLPPTANTPRQLAQAHQDLARALEVLSAEAQPLEWARAQAHQCALLRRVGELGHGDTLPQAARACRQALTVYTREHHPERWARTQAQLAHALFLHARSVRPEELRPLLTQSAEAFHQALTVLTREHQPQEWTAAQMHLGLALMNKDSPDMPDRASLGQAAEAYRQVLTTLSRERRPLEWAGVQAGLGVALYLQAERTPGEEGLPLLEQSIEAQRRALSVHGPAQQWDESCEALGLALGARAARTSRPLAVQPEDVSAHVLDIASALMGCSAKTVGGRLDALRAAIAARPPGPLGTRELDSLECVLGADPRWTASRDWLGALIRGLRASERDKVLTGIDEARARLPPLTPP